MLVLRASRSGKVCTRMGTEHHVHVVSRRGGIPAFLGIHKQASHLLGEASLAAKDSHQLNQLLTPLPTEKSKEKYKRRVHHTRNRRIQPVFAFLRTKKPGTSYLKPAFSRQLVAVGAYRRRPSGGRASAGAFCARAGGREGLEGLIWIERPARAPPRSWGDARGAFGPVLC